MWLLGFNQHNSIIEYQLAKESSAVIVVKIKIEHHCAPVYWKM